MITKKEEKDINDSMASGESQDAPGQAGGFLPEGTSIPVSESRYMRFSEPENRFRVLDSAIVGYELWVAGKPVRRKGKEEFTSQELFNADINKFTGNKKLPQYFWAFPVFNYQTDRIEILEVTQVSVMRGIEDYLKDADYGDPKGYDLNVIRDDSKDKLEYRVKAKPPKPVDEGVRVVYRDMKINLDALYEGKDPYESS